MADGRIGPAVARLEEAVERLIAAQTTIHNGHILSAPSLYDQLRADLPGTQGDTRSPAKSLPPFWVDAADMLLTIDKQVQRWLPAGTATPQRLQSLLLVKWRPQDTDRVERMAADVNSWCVQILGMVDPQSTKTISAPCPQCGQETVHRRDKTGELVRRAALQLVASTGCTCQACKAFWPPEKFLWLTKLLGFATPEGVCDTPEPVGS